MVARRFEVSIAFQTDKTPDEYEALGGLADAYGFDVVSVYSDLFFQPAIGPLLQLARRVKRARLGPAALNPYTLHPIEIAGQTALLDQASGGRAYLGLARGSWLDAVGVTSERPIARLMEAVEVVRYLLARRTDGYAGQIFQIARGERLQYAPPRPTVPITLGTWSRRTAQKLGPLVDEVKIGGSANPDMVGVMRQWLPERVGICLGAVTAVNHDRAAARALARREVARYLGVVARLDPTVDAGEDLTEGMSEAMLDRFAFAGTPDDILRQVQGLQSAGASRVEFGTPHGLDAAAGVRLLGEAVLPHVRR